MHYQTKWDSFETRDHIIASAQNVLPATQDCTDCSGDLDLTKDVLRSNRIKMGLASNMGQSQKDMDF